MSKPRTPASAIVGTSGSSGSRTGPSRASARSFPDLMCASDGATFTTPTCTSPARMALTTGGTPLNGMCRIGMWASLRNCSVASMNTLPPEP